MSRFIFAENLRENLRGLSFAVECCFLKNDPPSMLGIAHSSADPPFLSKISNAIAKNRATTGMGNCNMIHELYYPWNHRGAGPRHT